MRERSPIDRSPRVRYTNSTGGEQLESGMSEVARTISCREDGYFPDCDGVMRGETDE